MVYAMRHFDMQCHLFHWLIVGHTDCEWARRTSWLLVCTFGCKTSLTSDASWCTLYEFAGHNDSTECTLLALYDQSKLLTIQSRSNVCRWRRVYYLTARFIPEGWFIIYCYMYVRYFCGITRRKCRASVLSRIGYILRLMLSVYIVLIYCSPVESRGRFLWTRYLAADHPRLCSNASFGWYSVAFNGALLVIFWCVLIFVLLQLECWQCGI